MHIYFQLFNFTNFLMYYLFTYMSVRSINDIVVQPPPQLSSSECDSSEAPLLNVRQTWSLDHISLTSLVIVWLHLVTGGDGLRYCFVRFCCKCPHRFLQ